MNFITKNDKAKTAANTTNSIINTKKGDHFNGTQEYLANEQGVDSTLFTSLLSEIQRELISQWKAAQHRVSY